MPQQRWRSRLGSAHRRWVAGLGGLAGLARRRWRWVAVQLLVLIVLVLASAVLLDEPLRRVVEANVNARLKGYSAHIAALDFHPLGFSLDLKDVTVVQDAHPDPPVAQIPLLSASVHWRALLSGRLVGDILIDHPKVYVDLNHARKEIEDKVPVHERGWQHALQAIYPLKINQFTVVEGEVTYVDDGPYKPLELHRVNLRAGNIRNVRWEPGVYPSDVHLEAIVFDAGRIVVEGHADFLAEPHLAVQAAIGLAGIELDFFKPLTNRYNVSVRGGILSAAGNVEYAPHWKAVQLCEAVIEGVQIDYIHKAATAAKERQVVRKTVRAAEQVTGDPGVLLRIEQLKIVKSTFGFVNRATAPDYRLFLAHTDLTMENVSNQPDEGLGVAKVKGKFMGAGDAVAIARFRPEQRGPDFDVNVRIENTPMPTMNDLFRAYGKFDVAAGRFSFFSEISVKNGSVEGYVKPLFKDMDVYDKRQDKDKNLFRRMYEGLVGGISKLLENALRDEVATKAELAGRVENPEVGTGEVIIRLVQNAFFKAILPGFDQEVSRRRRSSSGA